MRRVVRLAILGALCGALHAGTAGAQALDCDGPEALRSIDLTELSTTPPGQSATVRFTAAPGCETATISVAAHATAFTSFQVSEVQPLLLEASGSAPAGAGSVQVRIPATMQPSQCGVQYDLVTGSPLDEVSPTSRYNALTFGLGDVDRLAAPAVYRSGIPCEAPTTTTTAGPPPTTIVERVTPAPVPCIESGTCDSVPPRIDDPLPSPPAPPVTIAEPILPITGSRHDTSKTVALAVKALTGGVAFTLLAAVRRFTVSS